MKYVLKISGHVFDSDELIEEYAKTIKELITRGVKLVIITGGGSIARKYVNIVRRLTSNEALADYVGIMVSRLNAYILATGLGDYAYRKIPTSIDEIEQAYSTGKVVILGGLQPGQSTVTVAILIAEYLGIDKVIDCANIDAVYTDDPKINPEARRLEKISISELLQILSRTNVKAGTYELIDTWALRIAKRSKITIYVVSAQEPRKILNIIFHNRDYGTVIIPD